MKAEDKAKELVDKMQWSVWSIADELLADIQAKQCALICAKMLAEQEDEYNCNDPRRKSEWWEVVEHIKQM